MALWAAQAGRELSFNHFLVSSSYALVTAQVTKDKMVNSIDKVLARTEFTV